MIWHFILLYTCKVQAVRVSSLWTVFRNQISRTFQRLIRVNFLAWEGMVSLSWERASSSFSTPESNSGRDVQETEKNEGRWKRDELLAAEEFPYSFARICLIIEPRNHSNLDLQNTLVSEPHSTSFNCSTLVPNGLKLFDKADRKCHDAFCFSQRIKLSLIHIWRCRRSTLCRSRWSPYH